MHTDESLEQQLAELALRGLGAQREAALLRALCDAEAAPRRWWLRGVPLWQAVAACLAVAVLAAASAYAFPRPAHHAVSVADRSRDLSSSPDAVHVFVPTTLLAKSTPYETDVTKWTTLHTP